MTGDIDLFRNLLRGVAERSPLPAALERERRLEGHRGLLLENGFVDGGAFWRAESSAPVEHSLWKLTPKGERFLSMSADEKAWEQLGEAYEAADFKWSLDELYSSLESQTDRR